MIPPWKKLIEWREFNLTLATTISTHAAELNQARFIAGDIQEQLNSITHFMDRLCGKTCAYCPTACCLSAKIWADFKDVLFWHLACQAVPLEQNISHSHDICQYLGSRGCVLPRLSRPFVCTWYLCPTQVSRLRRIPENDDRTRLQNALQSIKQQRLMMENAFVAAVS